MSRDAWDRIKRSKSFYVNSYRKVITALLVLVLINCLLLLATIYFYFNQPPTKYYASNGITAPILLKPLGQPNYTNEALLAPDIVEDNNTRLIPQ